MGNRAASIIIVGFLMLVSAVSAADQGTGFQWPNGAQAAVNLAYDDALDSQLDNAIPALDRYGFKGSFYLTLASKTISSRLDEWRTVAVNGHELGNHTLFHQCVASPPGRAWVKPYHDLNRVTADELSEHIELANTMLYAIDGRSERTFTAPCGDLYASGDNYVEAVKRRFVAIKAMDGGVTPDMRMLDPYLVGVVAPADWSGEQLIEMARQAAQKGTMVNFTFHGIGGDYLSISEEAHEQLLQYLDDNRDVFWVDTFINIMKYVENEN